MVGQYNHYKRGEMIGGFSNSNKGVPGVTNAQVSNPFASFVKKVEEAAQVGKLPVGNNSNPFYKGGGQGTGPTIVGLGTQGRPMGSAGGVAANTSNIFATSSSTASGNSTTGAFPNTTKLNLPNSLASMNLNQSNGGQSSNSTNNSSQNKPNNPLAMNPTNSYALNMPKGVVMANGMNKTNITNIPLVSAQNMNQTSHIMNPLTHNSNPLSNRGYKVQGGVVSNPFSQKMNTPTQGINILGQNISNSIQNANYFTRSSNPFPPVSHSLAQGSSQQVQNVQNSNYFANNVNHLPNPFNQTAMYSNVNSLNQSAIPVNPNMVNSVPLPINASVPTVGQSLNQILGAKAPQFRKQSLSPVIQTVFSRILSNPEGDDRRNSLKFTRIMLQELSERMQLMKPNGKLKPQSPNPEWNTPVDKFINKQMLLRFHKDQNIISAKIKELKDRQEQLLKDSENWEERFMERMVRSRQVMVDAVARSREIAQLKKNTRKMTEHMADLRSVYAPSYRKVTFTDFDEFCLELAEKIHRDYLKLDQRIEDLLVLQGGQGKQQTKEETKEESKEETKGETKEEEVVVMLKEYTVALDHRLSEVRELEDELRTHHLYEQYEQSRAKKETDDMALLLQKLDKMIAKRTRVRRCDRR